jgi:hypothetical protein
MRAGVAQGGLISPVLFSLYVNDMPSPSHHVELALYADDTAIITRSRKPTLLVSYLESYLNDLQRWLILSPASRSNAEMANRQLELWLDHPLSTLHPAFEDGTDSRYRNVGKSQSVTGKIPKRIHTMFLNS